MDIQEAFTFFQRDKDFVTKIGILAAIIFFSPFLLGIPYLLVIGYGIELTRNVRKGVENPLPEWNDMGKLFMDGLYLTIARVVYTFPLWLLLCGYLIFGVLGGLSGSEAVIAALLAGGMLMFCLLSLAAIALLFINPALVIQYVQTNEFGSLFQFGRVFGIVREQVGNIVMMIVVVVVASFAINFVISLVNILPIIGQLIYVLLAMAVQGFLSLVAAHLIGQMARGV